MKLSILLFLSTPVILASCSGQQSTHTLDKSATTTVGDTVKELGNNVMVIYHDKKNNYWFGSWEDGLYKYDGKTILHFTTKDGLCQNKIGNIQEDEAGNMYFRTDVGISKFNGQTFTTLSITGDEWKLQSGDLWFTGAQDSGLVYRYDGKNLHRLKFPATRVGEEFNAQNKKIPFPFSPYDVYTIYGDSKGNVWFGTSSLGACRYNGKTFFWLSEKDIEFDAETGFGIRSIIEDNDGKFWFSNTLHRFEIFKDGKYNKEKGLGSLDDKNKFDIVAIISMVKVDNDLWMATYNQGIWRYNDKQVAHYPVQYNDKDITVFSIYRDNNNELWLGTHENGAYKFNGKTFEKFRP